MDETKFDKIFNRMLKLMEWFPLVFGAFAIFWSFLCIMVVILVILALSKYLGLW